MKKASDYRRHADECRALSLKMDTDEQKDQCLKMAHTWEKLAADRSSLIRRHPELALTSERSEESFACSVAMDLAR